MSSPIDIGPATIERATSDLVVVRFKPGSIADPVSFRVSIEARRTHFSDHPHFVLLVAPDDSDFSPSILGKDQYKGHQAENFTLGLAFVCYNPTVRNIVELYFAHHPPPFPFMFFALEEDAHKWLGTMRTQLQGRST